MEEIQIIKRLESLKCVKPNSEWVSFAKGQILSKQFEKEVVKSVFASMLDTVGSAFETPKVMIPVLASLIAGIFGFALLTSQNTLPGDGLYSLKQATEQIGMLNMSPEQKAVAQVEQADKRLTELDKITEESQNQGNKLAAGIVEVQKALVVASKQLSNLPESQKAELVSNIVSKITKIEKTTNAAIMSNDSEDYQAFYKFLAQSEIKELEANVKNLTVSQKNLLSHAKESFDVSDYSHAVDLLHQIQPQ